MPPVSSWSRPSRAPWIPQGWQPTPHPQQACGQRSPVRPRTGTDGFALDPLAPVPLVSVPLAPGVRLGAATESDPEVLADADGRDEVSALSVSAAATAVPCRIATLMPSAAVMPATRPMKGAALIGISPSPDVAVTLAGSPDFRTVQLLSALRLLFGQCVTSPWQRRRSHLGVRQRHQGHGVVKVVQGSVARA